ncbi:MULTISPECIES: cyanase [Thiomicrorhabdus]|uniref:Cyanate hydratase n=1 Tax=Thiomicrorhabdus xiamenensis TaxID=2739063 RepID=A0A7D4ST33_9GAMM|nr:MULTISPECIES: cyanase [Thiomicrorhabdus]MBO1923400.1 cyanase [Thiomicrorhabdus sp. 6S3-12]QKI90163.1 cyanase [Thiomicrorhabdus xiamenensis]
MLTKVAMTEAIVLAKNEKGLGWTDIAAAAGLSEVYTTSACLGMNHLDAEPATKVAELLGLGTDVAEALQAFPHKSWEKAVPTDPLIYRLYEIVGVYGPTMKELIHEKFGDGIMSAIDFSMDIDKEENPLGDRVVVTMNGKFLPYKAW